MINKRPGFVLLVLLVAFTKQIYAQTEFSIYQASIPLSHLHGQPQNRAYLYTTAGDRLYAIGSQDGNFPEVGFHVPGEMGGVWQQPIKLLDGFRVKIAESGKPDFALNACDSFITYPFTASFLYMDTAKDLSVARTQFVPDGKPVLVLEYAVTNNSDLDRKLTLELTADINLMPVWLGERSGMIDHTDRVVAFDKNKNTLWAKDNNNPWWLGISSQDSATEFKGTGKTPYRGKGLSATLSATVFIGKRKTSIVHFFISGSQKGQQEIEQNIAETSGRLEQLFTAKLKRYSQLEKNAAIRVPDENIMKAYQWAKYSSDWLVRDVPGLGRAMSAGLPDYPWFFSNDQAATFNGLLGTVQPDIFFSSWQMLKQLSDKANDTSGRIIHEASANGIVYDKGRMEESQLHISAAWNIFRWTGDLAFLKENYAYGQKIWKWLQAHDSDQNGYIEGYGGVEIAGLNAEMLDVQVQTQSFLQAMGRMAAVQGNALASAAFQLRANRLRKMINKDWWVPQENRYADFISSRQKAIEIIDTALSKRVHPGRNDWAMKKLTNLRSRIQDSSYTNKGYVVYYNAPGILPVEEGIADPSMAGAVMKNISRFTNKFGMYISGIERPDDLSADEGNFKHDAEFNYNRAVMPVATAAIIIGACRYGYVDSALKYMHTLLNSFSYATPGTAYEVSPDYGMFVQAWNIIGFNVPLIQYFFGIDPLAYKKEISLHPNFPIAWKNASIDDVIIGNNRLSLQYSKVEGESHFRITSTQPRWSVKFAVPANRHVTVNGKNVTPKNNQVILRGKRNTIIVK